MRRLLNLKSCFNTAQFSQWQSSKEYHFHSHTRLSVMVRHTENTTESLLVLFYEGNSSLQDIHEDQDA